MGIFFVLAAFAVSKGACKLTPILRKIQFILKYGITRRKRDSLISDMDYYILSDYLNAYKAVKRCRQKLRDICSGVRFSKNIQWPSALSRDKRLATVGLAKVGV